MSHPPAVPSRRSVLRGAAAAGAVATAVTAAAPAHAAYTPVAYARTPIPVPLVRHLLSRFSYGYTPGLRAQVAAAGGYTPWFAKQLAPTLVPDSFADGLRAWYPDLSRTPLDLYARDSAGTRPGWQVADDFVKWTLLRRIYTQRQVQEVMTEFWSNLLYVHAGEASFGYRIAYDGVIRRHALGRFEDMLKAAITHPAMLVYLNGAVSTKRAVNENLGRELLELHTVGRGNHSEDDVLSSARILTGYRVDVWKTWQASYDPLVHWTGPVKVLGFTHANTDPDGRAVALAYLSYLARHPATARRIALRLCRTFVSDNPPAGLVDRFAATYLQHGTAIQPVLRALVASAEFRSATVMDVKVLKPHHDMVRTYRALNVKMVNSSHPEAAKNIVHWLAGSCGSTPYSWPRPDGEPFTNAASSSVGRVLGCIQHHWDSAGGWWPDTGVTFQGYASWAPTLPIRFDYLVDHLSRRLHGRPSTSALLQAACEMTALTPTTRIDAAHSLVRWRMPQLLAVLLDSPQHMTA